MLPMHSLKPQFLDMVEIFLDSEEAGAILEGEFDEVWEEGGVDFAEEIGDYSRVSDLFEGEDAMLLGYLQSLSI